MIKGRQEDGVAVGTPEPSGSVTPHDAPLLRGHETVLVAEDNDEVRDLTTRMLRSCGYTILAADDGRAALELARTHAGKIDLLITDLVMPGMSGATLGTRLAAAMPGLKVLYVSVYLDSGGTSQDLVSPTAAYLQKPFSPAALARKVREVLDGDLPTDVP